MKPILTGLLVLFIQSQAFTQSSPKESAEMFIRSRLADTDLLFTQTHRQGNVWIFENPGFPAFVMVKDEPGFPVIGYSTENTFTRNGNIGAPAEIFLEALMNNPASKLLAASGFKTGIPGMNHLLKTQWGQDDFFNFYCPKDLEGPGGRVMAGCVALAVGQIVRYYDKYNSFNFSSELETGPYGRITSGIGSYAWSVMENKPLVTDKEASRFLLGMGIITMMNYGPDFSTTSNYNAYDAFKKLKYFTADRIVASDTDLSTCRRLVLENLSRYQPVYVSGSGHAFVCDGFDAEGFFHFNLGWSGYADGYYPFDMLGMFQIDNYITGLAPYSNLEPPSNLRIENETGEAQIVWDSGGNQEDHPRAWRIYIDEKFYMETSGKQIGIKDMPAGQHLIQVSAVHDQGESRWIGPIGVYIAGQPVHIPDPSLRRAIQTQLSEFTPEITEESLQTGSMLPITRLEVIENCVSLEGLENCSNLQSLTILCDKPQILDLTPVYSLKRLKELKLTNVIPSNYEGFSTLTGLVNLCINGCQADSILKWENLAGLIELRIRNCPVLLTDPIGSMPELRILTMDGTGIDNLQFTNNLTNLEILEAINNSISQTGWTGEFPSMVSLNLRNNRLEDNGFLRFTPNLAELDAASNQFSVFLVDRNLARLKQIRIDNNRITRITASQPLPSLQTLIAGHNLVRSLDGLSGMMPAIENLDLRDNQIKWWKGSWENLKSLDLSDNSLVYVDNLSANPNLVHLNLADNSISDIKTLTNEAFVKKSEYINLINNPLSQESFQEYIPAMVNKTDTLLIPESPQLLSPCYLDPSEPVTISGPELTLSWSGADLPENSWFDVYMGAGPMEQKRIVTGLITNQATIETSGGKRMFWSVMTITPDSSFLSGYGTFNTFTPVTLPYFEDFESYESFGVLTSLSPSWISGSLSRNPGSDGRIERYRRFEGRQSVKIDNSCDLILPLEHNGCKDLEIRQYVLIEENRSGCIRINGIAGSDLIAYFKTNGKVDLYYNDIRQGEFDYPKNGWFSFQIRILPIKKYISIRLDGKYILNINWRFPAGSPLARELRYTWQESPLATSPGYPVFYVDNLEVSSISTSIEAIEHQEFDISILPNPASDNIRITHLNLPVNVFVTLIDGNGRVVSRTSADMASDFTVLDIRNQTPGIYFIRITGQGFSATKKLLVSR
ncbi:MAG TPA: hypothetical protein DC042_07465 [Bacteroidales bacterium]|nr:hypothetical protein [Bacteroidales bacterium]